MLRIFMHVATVLYAVIQLPFVVILQYWWLNIFSWFVTGGKHLNTLLYYHHLYHHFHDISPTCAAVFSLRLLVKSFPTQ